MYYYTILRPRRAFVEKKKISWKARHSSATWRLEKIHAVLFPRMQRLTYQRDVRRQSLEPRAITRIYGKRDRDGRFAYVESSRKNGKPKWREEEIRVVGWRSPIESILRESYRERRAKCDLDALTSPPVTPFTLIGAIFLLCIVVWSSFPSGLQHWRLIAHTYALSSECAYHAYSCIVWGSVSAILAERKQKHFLSHGTRGGRALRAESSGLARCALACVSEINLWKTVSHSRSGSAPKGVCVGYCEVRTALIIGRRCNPARCVYSRLSLSLFIQPTFSPSLFFSRARARAIA